MRFGAGRCGIGDLARLHQHLEAPQLAPRLDRRFAPEQLGDDFADLAGRRIVGDRRRDDRATATAVAELELRTSAPGADSQVINASGRSSVRTASHSTVFPAGAFTAQCVVRASTCEMLAIFSMNMARLVKSRQKPYNSSRGRLIVTAVPLTAASSRGADVRATSVSRALLAGASPISGSDMGLSRKCRGIGSATVLRRTPFHASRWPEKKGMTDRRVAAIGRRCSRATSCRAFRVPPGDDVHHRSAFRDGKRTANLWSCCRPPPSMPA